MGQYGNCPAIRGHHDRDKSTSVTLSCACMKFSDQRLFEFLILVSVILSLFHDEFCFQYLTSSSSEHVDLSAIALELQKLYRQVHQNNDLFFRQTQAEVVTVVMFASIIMTL